MSLGLSHSLARYKLKFSSDKVDTMIIQAIGLLDDLDKELNTYAYEGSDNILYAKSVKLMGNRINAAKLDFSEILADEVEADLKEAAVISMGTEVSDLDLLHIRELCDQSSALRLLEEQNEHDRTQPDQPLSTAALMAVHRESIKPIPSFRTAFSSAVNTTGPPGLESISPSSFSIGQIKKPTELTNSKFRQQTQRDKERWKLYGARRKLPSDKPATRKDAEGVRGAEMRNDPHLTTYPTGVAASVAAAARINQAK
ncbi:hypothetical protein Bca52824_061171 [Brassica carinata]|uniref:NOSIC domain-containing protein n=1 Tax=Brassica carinata TaxID=52824 RepID=A0A8X7UJW9_BRACI|nr:hypothetical protein Bca52824_061171 [Brassica carinata]